MNLQQFLLQYTERPFQWGQDDCSLFIADWWAANHGHDPAAELRGAYATREECHAIVRRAGGLVRLVTRIARAARAKRTRNPAAGAFGLIKAPEGHVGAIYTGEYWAVRNEQVGFLKNPRVVRAWQI